VRARSRPPRANPRRANPKGASSERRAKPTAGRQGLSGGQAQEPRPAGPASCFGRWFLLQEETVCGRVDAETHRRPSERRKRGKLKDHFGEPGSTREANRKRHLLNQRSRSGEASAKSGYMKDIARCSYKVKPKAERRKAAVTGYRKLSLLLKKDRKT
jgi:hypothetical protein